MYYDKTKQRTEAYIGTFGMDEQDQTELASVRRMVTNLNKDLKNMGYFYRYYVKAQARGHRQGQRWQGHGDGVPRRLFHHFNAGARGGKLRSDSRQMPQSRLPTLARGRPDTHGCQRQGIVRGLRILHPPQPS